MMNLEIITMLLILIMSAFIIGGVPNNLFGTIEFDDDIAMVKSIIKEKK